MKTSTMAFLSLALLACLNGCSRSDKAGTSQITGSVSYRDPVSLAPDTVLELRLTDVSGSDGSALEIAHISVANPGALPYQYSLPYDAARIDPQHRYTVDARVLTDGNLRYATDTAYEVLTQGHGTQRDITVIQVGENAPTLAQNMSTGASSDPDSNMSAVIFQNELRTGSSVSLYKAGIQDGHINWLEEDRSTGTPLLLHARYEFKGALIMRYADNSPLEINFDERGRATGITKNRQALKPSTQTKAINEVRNRAALLRSHALAASEARTHRQATGG